MRSLCNSLPGDIFAEVVRVLDAAFNIILEFPIIFLYIFYFFHYYLYTLYSSLLHTFLILLTTSLFYSYQHFWLSIINI